MLVGLVMDAQRAASMLFRVFPLQTISMYSSYALVDVVAVVAGWEFH